MLIRKLTVTWQCQNWWPENLLFRSIYSLFSCINLTSSQDSHVYQETVNLNTGTKRWNLKADYNNWNLWRNHSCAARPSHISKERIIKKNIQYLSNKPYLSIIHILYFATFKLNQTGTIFQFLINEWRFKFQRKIKFGKYL